MYALNKQSPPPTETIDAKIGANDFGKSWQPKMAGKNPQMVR
jgi:hypothetical protein